MSKVKNEATIKNPIVKAVREQLEHRALWLYLLCDEGGQARPFVGGLRLRGSQALGLYQGAAL